MALKEEWDGFKEPKAQRDLRCSRSCLLDRRVLHCIVCSSMATKFSQLCLV